MLELVASGLSNDQVAAALYIGRETVKSHMKSIFRKLEVQSRADAAVLGLRSPSSLDPVEGDGAAVTNRDASSSTPA